jgi:hypothetical protein
MLEDDQRFEELESKLAALSSQVESLELDTEVDPFFEDDVRRVIDDFKRRELAGLESEDFDGDDDDESSSSDDFISVQTTGGPSFKTHWISPTSCENMTRDLARDAFIQGAADRYGTSQQVNNGDVLILLCREPVAGESVGGSEPAAPREICRYIGLAYNTLVHPASAEPTSETEESISAPVGNYEIFVWSSCECTSESPKTVTLPSVFEENTSASVNHGSYSSIGQDTSPDTSTASSLLTSAVIRKDNATKSVDVATGLSNTITITGNNSGYKTDLVTLSKDLSEFYLDRETKDLTFNGDKKILNAHTFSSDNYVSKDLTLSNEECLNLYTVSMGNVFDLSLLREGAGSDGCNVLTTASVSLGVVTELEDSVAIETYDFNSAAVTTTPVDDQVFLPVISSENADKISKTISDFLPLTEYDVTIEASYSVIYEDESKGDAEYRFYKQKKATSELTWASGLLVNYEEGELSEKELIGVIRVNKIPVTYSCDPVYGCMPDPVGEYDEDTCGGNCEYYSFTPSGSGGYLWLWDSQYISIGPEDNSDLSEEDWGYEDTLQYREDFTHLIYNGQRYRLDPPNSGQYEFEWWTTGEGGTSYLGGSIGSLSGSLPFEWTTSEGYLQRKVTTSRPIGYPSNISSRDLITGELIKEEDFIEFNF